MTNPISPTLGCVAAEWIYANGTPAEDAATISLEHSLIGTGVMNPVDAIINICASDEVPAISLSFESGALIMIDARTGEYCVTEA